MKLKNVLIAVSDIERSRKIYHDVFGLETVVNSEGNVILTEGLVLQDAKVWSEALGREIRLGNNAGELFLKNGIWTDSWNG